MTKEEIEKEADDYADKHAFRVPYDGSNKFYDDVDFKASKEGYLAGAEPREKRIAGLKKRIHTLEVYLEGAVNYLILAGDVDNRIISDVETILHMTFNKSPNVPNVFQKFTKAKELIKKFLVAKSIEDTCVAESEAERFLSEVEK